MTKEGAGVLSADEIERLSKKRFLRPDIEPLIEDLEVDNLKGAAYDLRMATDGMVLPDGLVLRPNVDGEHHRSPVILEPGQTAFISTRERLNVPDWLTGNISIKGELAGKGILLLTGLIVDPGYKKGGSGDGRLHFRLANLGKRPVVLEPGRTRIASIQFLRLDGRTRRPPGRSFDDVWERVDELREGLGFLEDLRTLSARVSGLDAEVSRQGRSINLVVVAVMVVVMTTLLGIVIAGLLTLGSSVDLVRSAERVVPDSAGNRILALVGLFGLAALIAACASVFRVRRDQIVEDPSGLSYARTEALRDLRIERARSSAIVLIIICLLGVGGVAVAVELSIAWWIVSAIWLGLTGIVLWRAWKFIWWSLPRWKVEQRVHEWEREALDR